MKIENEGNSELKFKTQAPSGRQADVMYGDKGLTRKEGGLQKRG